MSYNLVDYFHELMTTHPDEASLATAELAEVECANDTGGDESQHRHDLESSFADEEAVGEEMARARGWNDGRADRIMLGLLAKDQTLSDAARESERARIEAKHEAARLGCILGTHSSEAAVVGEDTVIYASSYCEGFDSVVA